MKAYITNQDIPELKELSSKFKTGEDTARAFNSIHPGTTIAAARMWISKIRRGLL